MREPPPPGTLVELRRRDRRPEPAYVVDVRAERFDVDGRPLPYRAERGERRVGLAVPDGAGAWRPGAARPAELRPAGRRPQPVDASGRPVDAYLLEKGAKVPDPWQALVIDVEWVPGRLPWARDRRREVYRLGIVHGYPPCCALDYRRRAPDRAQRAASQGSGYLPCPACAAAVLADMSRGAPGPDALRARLLPRLHPDPLVVPGEPSPPHDSPLVRQPDAWRALIAARCRRVELALDVSRFLSTDSDRRWVHALIDRETRTVDSLRWLLGEDEVPPPRRRPDRLYLTSARSAKLDD